MTPVGLYSIGVRDLTVPELLNWAYEQQIPFMHLRGGPRGHHVGRRDEHTLRLWAQHAARTVPITGLTSDVDLGEVLAGQPTATDELARLTRAAQQLGAGWVRLLAQHSPPAQCNRHIPALARQAVPVLVELHHPDWYQPTALDGLEALLQACPRVRLLTDTAQLQHPEPAVRQEATPRVLARSQVLHLSDSGPGLDAPGHRAIAAAAARRQRRDGPMEVAFEWTGPDRSRRTCLDRYHRAATWWQRIMRGTSTR